MHSDSKEELGVRSKNFSTLEKMRNDSRMDNLPSEATPRIILIVYVPPDGSNNTS